jgi:hypothetical protein
VTIKTKISRLFLQKIDNFFPLLCFTVPLKNVYYFVGPGVRGVFFFCSSAQEPAACRRILCGKGRERVSCGATPSKHISFRALYIIQEAA